MSGKVFDHDNWIQCHENSRKVTCGRYLGGQLCIQFCCMNSNKSRLWSRCDISNSRKAFEVTVKILIIQWPGHFGYPICPEGSQSPL